MIVIWFKTTVTSKVFTEGTYSIFTIENINDIRYLKYILIYINSFLDDSQKGIKDDLKLDIDRICKKS